MSYSSYSIVLIWLLVLSDVLMAKENLFRKFNFRRHRRQNELQCKTPKYPEHGKWTLSNGRAKPGDMIPESSYIKYECDPEYSVATQNEVIFCNEYWDEIETFPECEKLCPPLYSSTIFDMKCRDKNGSLIPCSKATHMTYLEYSCNSSSYEVPSGVKTTRICEDGIWRDGRPVCQPICGTKIFGAKPLVAGVVDNDRLEYPWIVAVYSKENGTYENICGGSLVSTTVVLTAAHCVVDKSGTHQSEELFAVGAGKLYIDYENPNDIYAQYRKLLKVIVNDHYNGGDNRYAADLALLITKEEFIFNDNIQPVCFKNLDQLVLPPGKVGEISGWGLTEEGLPSKKLRTLKITHKNKDQCTKELGEFAKRFFSTDKICTGFYKQNKSVCSGDSGSGLTYENWDDKRYYIHGVLSVAPTNNQKCNTEQNALYTKVASYYDDVERLLMKYTPEIKDCKLPRYPRNGSWVVDGHDNWGPRDLAPSSAILKIGCGHGFKLSPPITKIKCGLAHNMPTCQLLCPVPMFPKNTEYNCKDGKGKNINCSDAIDGSTLQYTCPKGYKSSHGTTTTTSCTKGSWGSPAPECIKSCGKALGNDFASRESEDGLDYPWNVAIYWTNRTVYDFIFGGTLISKKVVLTAAHSVADNFGFSKTDNLIIGAGKSYFKYNDSRDVHAQYSEISHTVIHSAYRGSKRGYSSDIALVVLKSPFTLNSFIQPVCFYDVKYIQLEAQDKGVLWGRRLEDNAFSEKLGTLEIPYRNISDCEKELPKRWVDAFITYDKICTGFYNESSHLCYADGGSGLTFKNPQDDRYYIHGVLTLSPFFSSTCHRNIFYTNVSTYYDFVDNILTMSEYQ